MKRGLSFSVRSVGMRPHPTKRAPAGEDAFLLKPSTLGVADGVGGWRKLGVDSGVYSRGFMWHLSDIIDDHQLWEPGEAWDPVALLIDGARHMKALSVPGSMTAAVCSLSVETLRVAWVGDCQCIVMRNGRCVFESTPTMHSLMRPCQLGNTSATDAKDAKVVTVQVEPGDVVLAGSDGLFDNLSVPFIVHHVHSSLEKRPANQQAHLDAICDRLAHEAQCAARGEPELTKGGGMTPFRDRMLSQGFNIAEAGKLDDTTVVIGIVAADCRDNHQQMLDRGDRVPDSAAATMPPSCLPWYLHELKKSV